MLLCLIEFIWTVDQVGVYSWGYLSSKAEHPGYCCKSHVGCEVWSVKRLWVLTCKILPAVHEHRYSPECWWWLHPAKCQPAGWGLSDHCWAAWCWAQSAPCHRERLVSASLGWDIWAHWGLRLVKKGESPKNLCLSQRWPKYHCRCEYHTHTRHILVQAYTHQFSVFPVLTWKLNWFVLPVTWHFITLGCFFVKSWRKGKRYLPQFNTKM